MIIVVNVAYCNWLIQNIASYQSVRIIVVDALSVPLFDFSGFSGKYSPPLVFKCDFVD